MGASVFWGILVDYVCSIRDFAFFSQGCEFFSSGTKDQKGSTNDCRELRALSSEISFHLDGCWWDHIPYM